MTDMSALLVGPELSLEAAMEQINRNMKGIVLVVDADHRLLGTITDGNIRRALLAGTTLNTELRALIGKDETYPEPVTTTASSTRADQLALMRRRGVRQLPLVDSAGRVIDLVVLEDLLPGGDPPLTAVVMAGGEGTRLRPLTDATPKPMLPVGGRPLMEHIIEGLREAGVTDVSVTTHYKAEAISAHFRDGSGFGVNMQYIQEDSPLGTAGALALMERPSHPILVVNGDILTKADYRAMLAFHGENDADLTVGVREFELNVPYGVVETRGVRVEGIREKPTLRVFVNAGIYVLSPTTHGMIPGGRRLDMTDFIEILLEQDRKIVSFPICEYWIDIGQPTDYEQANVDYRQGRRE